MKTSERSELKGLIVHGKIFYTFGHSEDRIIKRISMKFYSEFKRCPDEILQHINYIDEQAEKQIIAHSCPYCGMISWGKHSKNTIKGHTNERCNPANRIMPPACPVRRLEEPANGKGIWPKAIRSAIECELFKPKEGLFVYGKISPVSIENKNEGIRRVLLRYYSKSKKNIPCRDEILSLIIEIDEKLCDRKQASCPYCGMISKAEDCKRTIVSHTNSRIEGNRIYAPSCHVRRLQEPANKEGIWPKALKPPIF